MYLYEWAVRLLAVYRWLTAWDAIATVLRIFWKRNRLCVLGILADTRIFGTWQPSNLYEFQHLRLFSVWMWVKECIWFSISTQHHLHHPLHTSSRVLCYILLHFSFYIISYTRYTSQAIPSSLLKFLEID